VFFAHYVTSFTKTWDFLSPFYHEAELPPHFSLSINAASLAFLSHQVNSRAAASSAREKYTSALKLTAKALQCPEVATKQTTLLTSLLLDLFEKITFDEPRHISSWTSHVKGALSLVNLRGVEQFQDNSSIRVLNRLSTNLLITCVASESPVPRELLELRAHAEKYINIDDPKWHLSNYMIEYARLRSEILYGRISVSDVAPLANILESKLHAFELSMPTEWQYTSESLAPESEHIFNRQSDMYPDRQVKQTRNVVRLVRILLNKLVVKHCGSHSEDISLAITANDNIDVLANEICASVPQYTYCVSEQQVASTESKLPDRRSVERHTHSPEQALDCYTLIFPLYVVGQSIRSATPLKSWVIDQLHHMGSHFGIKNAEMVAKILEQGADVDPWAVYAMLGSYAFAT